MARRNPKLATESTTEHEERTRRKQPVFAPGDRRFGAAGGRGRGDNHCRVCDTEGIVQRLEDGYKRCVDIDACVARTRAAADARAAAIEPVHIGR